MAIPITAAGKATAAAGGAAGAKSFGQIAAGVAGVAFQFIGGRLLGDGQKKSWSDPEDLKIQSNIYGEPIPIIFGVREVAGKVIWLKGNSMDEKWIEPGGKKGKGGSAKSAGGRVQRRATFAALICLGSETHRLARMKADTKVIFDARESSQNIILAADGAPVQFSHDGIKFTIYPGGPDQDIDPRIEADLGIGNVPSWHGHMIMVADDWILDEFGNRPPNLLFEVYSDGVDLPAGNGYTVLTPDGSTPYHKPVTIDPHRPYAFVPGTGGVWKWDLFSKSDMKFIPFESVDLSQWHTVATGVVGIETSNRVGLTREGNFFWSAAINNYAVAVLANQSGNVISADVHKITSFSSTSGGRKSYFFDLSEANFDGDRQNAPISPRRFGVQLSGNNVSQLTLWELVGSSWIFRGSVMISGVQSFFRGVAFRPPLRPDERHTVYTATSTPVSNSMSLVARQMYEQADTFEGGVFEGIGTDTDPWPDGGLLWSIDQTDLPSGVGQVVVFLAWLEEIDKLCVHLQSGAMLKVDPLTGAIEETALAPEGFSGFAWDTNVDHQIVDGYSERGFKDGRTFVGFRKGSTEYFAEFDATTWTYGTPFEANIGGGDIMENWGYEPWSHSFIYEFNFSFRRVFGGAVRPNRVKVKDIISYFVGESGVEANEYDVSTIPDETDVLGFGATRESTNDKIIEPLLEDFQIGEATINGKMTFKPLRFSTVVRSLTEEDYATASDPGDDDDLRLLKAKEIDPTTLPRVVHLSYSDPDRNYDLQTARAFRDPQVVSSDDISTIRTPVIYTADEAADTVWRRLKAIHSGLIEIEAPLGRRDYDLAPLDVVQLSQGDTTYPFVRIDDMEYADVLTIKGRTVHPLDFDATIAGLTPNLNPVIGALSDSVIVPLDTHLLRQSDDNDGHYMAISMGNSGRIWFGAVLWQSPDRVTWDTVQGVSTAAAYGTVRAFSLAEHFTFGWDRKSSITVDMTVGTLFSTTEAEVLDGENVALWEADDGEWEVIQWATAIENADGTFTLTDILRGRKGTEQFANRHATGSRLIVVHTSLGLLRMEDQKDLKRYYVGTTVGQEPTFSQAIEFTNLGRGKRCFAPVEVAATEDGSSNVDVSWTRRTRFGGEDRTFTGSVPLNEESEKYQIEVRDPDGALIRGPLTVEDATTWQYAIADRTTDSTADNSTYPYFDVEIRQVSAIFGPGLAGTVRFYLVEPAVPILAIENWKDTTSGTNKATHDISKDGNLLLKGTINGTGGGNVMWSLGTLPKVPFDMRLTIAGHNLPGNKSHILGFMHRNPNGSMPWEVMGTGIRTSSATDSRRLAYSRSSDWESGGSFASAVPTHQVWTDSPIYLRVTSDGTTLKIYSSSVDINGPWVEDFTDSHSGGIVIPTAEVSEFGIGLYLIVTEATNFEIEISNVEFL